MKFKPTEGDCTYERAALFLGLDGWRGKLVTDPIPTILVQGERGNWRRFERASDTGMFAIYVEVSQL